MKKALIISDGKPGHVNQSIALANHLQIDYDEINITFKSLVSKALSYIFDWLFIYNLKIFNEPLTFNANNYDVIISTGSSTFYANKVIKKNLNIKNIAILYPKGYRLNYDYVIIPKYDKTFAKKNIIKTPINICNSDPQWFSNKATQFTNNIHKPLKNSIGIIIGGPNEKKTVDILTLEKQLDLIFLQNKDSEIWITTSRRTTLEIENLLNNYEFDYKLKFSQNNYNPIPAFIELCKNLYITDDSTSMISEAVSYGNANVYIIPLKAIKKKDKFSKFCKILVENNSISFLSKNPKPANNKINLNSIFKSNISI